MGESKYCNFCASEELPSGVWGCDKCKPNNIDNRYVKYKPKKGDILRYSITGTEGEFIGFLDNSIDHCIVDFGLSDCGIILLKNLELVKMK